MNKAILLTCCLLLAALGLFAQSGFDLGVSGTFNSTWILKQNNYGTLAAFHNTEVQKSRLDYTYTWGGNGGICIGYKITKHWGVQAEVQYDATGQKYNDNLEGPATIPEGTFGPNYAPVNVQRTLKLNYIQIPFMVKYTAGKKNVKFFACLGPQIGIRTTAYEQVKIASYVYLPDSLNFTIAQKFQTFDIGFALQAGVQIYATPHLYFDIGLSAYEGIFDINGPKIKSYSQDHGLYYQHTYNFRGGIMVGIHYVFWRNRGGLLKSTTPDKK